MYAAREAPKDSGINSGGYTRRVMTSSRNDLLASEAERIASFLAERGATLVVAFGSFARGDTAAGSDLDLIAVLPSDLPFIRRLTELYGRSSRGSAWTCSHTHRKNSRR